MRHPIEDEVRLRRRRLAVARLREEPHRSTPRLGVRCGCFPEGAAARLQTAKLREIGNIPEAGRHERVLGPLLQRTARPHLPYLVGKLAHCRGKIAEEGEAPAVLSCAVLVRPYIPALSAAANTPYNEPVFIRMFWCSPKQAMRMTEASTRSTIVGATDLMQNVHYAYTSEVLPFFGPLLNREFFRVYGFTDYQYQPSIVSVTTTTAVVDPNAGAVKKLYWKMHPNLTLDGKFQPWNQIEDDDVPFTQQVYCIILSHTTILGHLLPSHSTWTSA